MKWTLGTLLVEIIIFFVFNSFIYDFEVAAVLFIVINIFSVLMDVIKYKEINMILFFSYILRVFAMFWDRYMNHIFNFPNSGKDSSMYFRYASLIANDLSIIGEDIRGGIYSKILGIVYYLTVPERLIGQYLNVLLGVSIIITIYKILKLLSVDKKIIVDALLVIACFPNAIIFSAIHLRESFIAFLVVISFYMFIKWYSNRGIVSLINSFIYLLLASIFHSGVIAIILGYLFVIMFYNAKKKRYIFTKKSIGVFLIFLIVTSIIFSKYSDLFMGKFSKLEDISDIYLTANSRIGRTAYLTNLIIDSPIKMLIFGPIKMLYFLISPVPLDWRGFNDILTFFIDSIFYLRSIYIIVKYYKSSKKIEPLSLGVGIILLSVVWVFGIGVSNAGTAMRHRYKIMPIILIFISLLKDRSNKYRYKRYYKK